MYVANSVSNTVSVIDGISDKVIVKGNIIMNVKPENFGTIICNDEEIILNYNFNLPFKSKCLAKPNKDFQFISWTKNIGDNAIKTINASTDTDSIFSFFSNNPYINSNDEKSELTILDSGYYTANFAEIPAPIPKEYSIALFGIIASTIVGWSIPSIIKSIKSKGDIRKLNFYHKQINSLYNDGKLDENDISQLNKIKINILDDYSKGKINELHYSNLKEELSISYHKIFNKLIEKFNTEKNVENNKLDKIKYSILDAYSDGKLNELHYNLLKEKISEFENKKN